jgi:hypothetical protein
MTTVTEKITTFTVDDWTIETSERVLESEVLAEPTVFDRKFALISKSGARYFASSLDNAYSLISYYSNMGK